MSWQRGPPTPPSKKNLQHIFVTASMYLVYIGISHSNHKQNHRKNVESHLAMSRFFITVWSAELGALRSNTVVGPVALMQNLDSELDAGGLEDFKSPPQQTFHPHRARGSDDDVFFVCQEHGGVEISPKTERFWEDRMFFDVDILGPDPDEPVSWGPGDLLCLGWCWGKEIEWDRQKHILVCWEVCVIALAYHINNIFS